MIMRKILLFALLLLCFGFSKAQLDSFDLSTYKLPDIKRHMLDFNVDLSGSSYSLDEYYRNQDDEYRKSNYIGGYLDMGYTFYRNTEKIQSNQVINMNFRPSFSDIKDEDILISESYDLGGRVYINSENRFYYITNKFVETNLEYSWERSKSENDNLNVLSTSNLKSLRVSVPIALGTGRIDEIQDARLAIYILNDLKKHGSLSRIPNDSEILEFAQLISKLKSERFFDSREKKIYEIEQVDAFLQSNGLIDSPDSKYFTLVNDNWDFASLPLRKTGNRFSFGITPELNHYSTDDQFDYGDYGSSNYEYYKKEYGINAKINFIKENPINLYWQSSFQFSLSGKYLIGTVEFESPNSEVKVESPQLNSSIFYSIGFYPNTRTYLSMNVGLNYSNSFGTELIGNEEIEINHFEIDPQFIFRLSYYISPQFKLNCRYSIYYIHQESNSEYFSNYRDYSTIKNLNQYLGIGFVYQIL
jgi:hypothetical protein